MDKEGPIPINSQGKNKEKKNDFCLVCFQNLYLSPKEGKAGREEDVDKLWKKCGLKKIHNPTL